MQEKQIRHHVTSRQHQHLTTEIFASIHQSHVRIVTSRFFLNLEVRNGDCNSLRITVADADGDLLDTSLLGSGSGGTVKLNGDLPLASLIMSIERKRAKKNLR